MCGTHDRRAAHGASCRRHHLGFGKAGDEAPALAAADAVPLEGALHIEQAQLVQLMYRGLPDAPAANDPQEVVGDGDRLILITGQLGVEVKQETPG
jgi:hypothetical protein